MTCEKCYHNEVCKALYELNGIPRIGTTECAYFRDKDHLIEAPCAVGDKVYRFCEFPFSWDEKCQDCPHFEAGWYDDPSRCAKTKDGYKYAECLEIEECVVDLTDILGYMEQGAFGKTVFLTREAAEAAVEERRSKHDNS